MQLAALLGGTSQRRAGFLEFNMKVKNHEA
jgi:hypothetical protein